MTTQRWWWPTLALMVVLLSTVVGSKFKGPCATGSLVMPANQMKQLPAAINNTAGPPIVSCYDCAYMVISANTQTQIIFHCFYAIKKLFLPIFPDTPKHMTRLTYHHFSWKDQPSKGESASLRRKISPSMTFKDALDEHEKIFPPPKATGFHCYNGKFKARFSHHQMVLGHLRPMHIQSTGPKMKCSIKVVAARKGRWFFRGSTIEYGSVEQHLCPKKGCEQNEDGKSGICCCHGSGCNNAPLMYAVTWIATAHGRAFSKRVSVNPASVMTTPAKTTAASTTSTAVTRAEIFTATKSNESTVETNTETLLQYAVTWVAITPGRAHSRRVSGKSALVINECLFFPFVLFPYCSSEPF